MWDEAKYPTMSPLKEIVDGIHVQISRIEDDLKVCSIFELMSAGIEVYMILHIEALGASYILYRLVARL